MTVTLSPGFHVTLTLFNSHCRCTEELLRTEIQALFRPYTHTLGRIFKGGRFFQGGDIFSLAVFAIPYYMATLARCAPLSNSNALVDSPQMQTITQTSRSLVEKIRLSIPDTHASCIRSETLQLNSSENTKFTIMASKIGIPAAPVLKAVSERFPLETCLKRISEGLQLHRALLAAVAPPLKNQDEVTNLQADIRDLIIHINKMLKMLGGEAVAQPTVAPVSLNMEGTYEVQVAAHLTLVQLQSFALDVACCLRSLDRSNEEDADRCPPGD